MGQFTEFFNAKEADTRKYVFIKIHFLLKFKVYQFFQIEPPEDSREKAVWNRANKPPTPEPEPEVEAEEAAESEEAAEGEEAGEGEQTEETPEEGAPTDYPEGELEEVSILELQSNFIRSYGFTDRNCTKKISYYTV